MARGHRCSLGILCKFFSQAVVSVKISNLLICFYRFDLSCSIPEKDNFIKILYILCCLIK